ncbi:MAG: lysostaphin resistance A-like protein [Candidatus Ventricola sp.]
MRTRSALLLSAGACLAMALYRLPATLNGTGFRTQPFGLVLELAATALVFGGASHLGLRVLDGDQRKILPRAALSRAQALWLSLLGALAVAPMTLGADVLRSLAYGGGTAGVTFAVRAPGAFILALLKSALLVPVLEELFFRGYLLHALERYGRGRAAWVSALCFALAHMGGVPHVWLLYTAMGLLLSALTLRTGSLLAPVLVHGVYNLTLIVLEYAGLGGLFAGLTLPSCALRLGLCLAFVYALRRALASRGAHAQVKPLGRLSRRDWALLIAAAVLALVAALLS